MLPEYSEMSIAATAFQLQLYIYVVWSLLEEFWCGSSVKL
jgi:hypothetical protein